MADLTNLTDVKAWLKVTGNTDDALLQKLITGASAIIESWLSRSFAQASYAEVRNGHGGSTLMFADYPVTDVSSVKVNNVSIPAAADCTQPGYLFDDISLTLQGGYSFSKGMKNVTIQYTAGYAAIPSDVAQICFELVAKKYRERDRIGQNSKTLAGEIVAFAPSDLTDEVKSMLRNYQKVIPV